MKGFIGKHEDPMPMVLIKETCTRLVKSWMEPVSVIA